MLNTPRSQAHPRDAKRIQEAQESVLDMSQPAIIQHGAPGMLMQGIDKSIPHSLEGNRQVYSSPQVARNRTPEGPVPTPASSLPSHSSVSTSHPPVAELGELEDAEVLDGIIEDGADTPESAESSMTSLSPVSSETLESELAPTERKRKQGERLSHAEIRLVLMLRDSGLSQSTIATRLNCTQTCVSRILAAWADTRVEAKATIRKKSKDLADKLVREANADQILEIFDREGILEKKRNTTDESGRVNVMIGIRLPDVGGRR